MSHITRYGRRIRRMLVSSMTAACFACLFAVPFAEKKLFNNDVGYYSIVFNGTTIGSANSVQDAEKAIAEARKKFSNGYDSVVYVDGTFDIVKEDRLTSKRMSNDELESSIYDALFACVTEKENATAYTVRIDDFTITLATKEEVVELMQRVTAKYDTDNAFQVTLNAGQEAYGEYSVDVVRSSIYDKENNIVSSTVNGETVLTDEKGELVKDGVTGLSFEQEVTVTETLRADADVVSVDEAYEAVTKEKAEKTLYTVAAGDTLSAISRKCEIPLKDIYAMNENLSESTIIVPGDQVVVTVPKAEISVVLTVRKTYEEDYEAEVKYVDNNNAYRGQNTVIDNGSTGRHIVTADVTYVNGVESSVNYVDETVLVEAKPKVVSVGTKTPPRYVRPITGGYLTSPFGPRWGSYHSGVDWGVVTGTKVMAAADGKVVRAGWYSSYGICVDIQHKDGSMTRYAHLSATKVNVGDTVTSYQVIGLSGNTGYSTGPHLHFAIYINGTAVNPLNYVSK